jgi:hypothetical protein
MGGAGEGNRTLVVSLGTAKIGHRRMLANVYERLPFNGLAWYSSRLSGLVLCQFFRIYFVRVCGLFHAENGPGFADGQPVGTRPARPLS